MNKIKENLKYITVMYVSVVECVKHIIQEHYDTPEYSNTVFFINVLPDKNAEEQMWANKYNKRIYYQLEHRIPNSKYYNKIYEFWDNGVADLVRYFNIDEMWTMDYEPQFALKCNKMYNIPIKYMPVRYTSLIKQVPDIYTTKKTVDCAMIGLIKHDSPQRLDFYEELETKHYFSFKAITQTKNIHGVIPELNSSRFILDIPKMYEIETQNQVRIFELLCMGYTVISKKYHVNLFPDLIYQYENFSDIANIVKNSEYIHPTEYYKSMTYTDEAYEKYVNNLIEQQKV